jgi:hypothetical protein
MAHYWSLPIKKKTLFLICVNIFPPKILVQLTLLHQLRDKRTSKPIAIICHRRDPPHFSLGPTIESYLVALFSGAST